MRYDGITKSETEPSELRYLLHHSPTFHLPYGRIGTVRVSFHSRMVSGGEGVGMGRVGMRM